MIRATLTIWPLVFSGSGIEPIVAIVSRVQMKPPQAETSSVSMNPIVPAI